MARRPKTLYTDVDGAQIAYQVFGQPPPAPVLVQVMAGGYNIEVSWDDPFYAASMERLGSFSRVIVFNQRGRGISDPLPTAVWSAYWEGWCEDLRAVLDAEQCERAAIVASVDVGPSAMLFAAIYPERTSALFLVNTAARFLWAEDYPCGVSPETAEALVTLLREGWGRESNAALWVPSMASDAHYMEFTARLQRLTATPWNIATSSRAATQGDVREVLPLIQAPTIVLHQLRNPLIPIAMGRYLAEHICDARFVELPGEDSWFYGEDTAYDLIEEMLTGGHRLPASQRSFASVLVEDIVGSTERAVELGDERWTALLDRHDAAAGLIAESFRGRIVKTTGDGVVAVFDVPSRAIRCALSLREATRSLGLDVRIGIHAGEIERRYHDVAGVSVHTAARVSAHAQAGEVLVSRTVPDLVAGSGIEFDDRGDHELKGVPGTWRLYAVRG